MKFKVGDRVQIKTWKEMEKEFGTRDGNIRTHIVFSKQMRHLCGTFATIDYINEKTYSVCLKDMTTEGYIRFIYSPDMLKPANPEKYELHIMSDGNKTTAVYKKNGDVVSRSEANLHPDDEFNFKTGAQIAFDRVFQPEPEKKEPKKLRLFNAVGNCYGTVGTPTKYKDVYGRPLFVGDIVEVENAFLFMQFVCEDEDGAYVMGLKKYCDTKTGTIRDWKVQLATPFTEVKDGTEICLVACRLK